MKIEIDNIQIVLFICFISDISAFTVGAPPSACTDTIPSHGVNPQTSTSPYSLQVTPGTGRYTVTINSAVTFKGFLLKAKTASGPNSEYVGQFSVIPTPTTEYVSCGDGNQQAVTQVDSSDKQNLQFEWIPVADCGEIVFQLTVVQTQLVFWINVFSSQITVPCDPSLTTQPVPTTTVSPGTIPTDAECGITKGCFENCQGTVCSHIVTWKNAGDSIEFEIKSNVASGDQWVAIGFSSDSTMGDDNVISCLSRNGVVSLEHSYNVGKQNQPFSDVNLGLTLLSSSREENALSCHFQRQKNVTGEPRVFDLDKRWVLLFAKGPVDTSGQKSIHIETPEFSAQVVDFLSTERLGGATTEYTLVKVHASLMLLAWILFSSVGIVTARYVKSGWSDKTLFGLKVWFQVHRACMAATLVFTIISFIVIFIEIEGYSDIITADDKTYLKSHPVLGIIVTALTMINPIMAFFRPGPDSEKRLIFNWSHRIVGLLAQVTAAITIFFGFDLGKSKAPPETTYIMAAYVVCFVTIQITMEILQCYNKHKAKISGQFELQQTGQKPQESIKKGNSINTWLLYLHILLMTSFSVAIIVLIV